MGSGQILIADLGPALWSADVTTVEMLHRDATELEALADAIGGPSGSFYLYDPRSAYPKADPTGALLGAANVQINSLPDAKSISLKGLPPGYVLSAGDYLAFDYASNPTRRALHRLAEAVTANGAGVTPAVEVRPFLRPGAAVSAAVMLKKAAARAIIVPGSFDASSVSALTSRITFKAMQKI